MANDVSGRDEVTRIKVWQSRATSVLILAVVVLLASYGFGQTVPSREDYSIYAKVLNDIYRQDVVDQNKTKGFVIVGETAGDDYQELLPRKTAGLRADYLSRNKTPASIAYEIPVRYPITVVSRSEIDMPIGQGKKDEEIERARDPQSYSECGSWWHHFYQRYPQSNGYHQFSRVGYSSNRKYAYVMVDSKGGCWDWHQSYLLKREVRGWKIYMAAGSGGVS